MRLTNDDAITRFQGRWIDARGSQMWVIARYSAWAAFGVLVFPTFLLLRIVVRFDLLMSGIAAVVICAFAGKVIADLLADEYGVRSWLGLLNANSRTHARRKADLPKRRRGRRLI